MDKDELLTTAPASPLLDRESSSRQPTVPGTRLQSHARILLRPVDVYCTEPIAVCLCVCNMLRKKQQPRQEITLAQATIWKVLRKLVKYQIGRERLQKMLLLRMTRGAERQPESNWIRARQILVRLFHFSLMSLSRTPRSSLPVRPQALICYPLAVC